MKKLMAIVLGIALLSPTPANANTDNEIKDTFLKIISGNDIELQPLTGHPGWTSSSQGSGWYLEDYTKISLGVSVCRSGIPVWLLECAMNAKKITFSIVDATGRHVHFTNVSNSSWKNGLEILSVKNVNIELSPVPRLVMPLSLKVEFEFHPTSSQTMKTFYYPLNVRFNKIDIAKQEAEAKALAEAKAEAVAKVWAEAEAKAKAEAEAKAQREADAKASQEFWANEKAEKEKTYLLYLREQEKILRKYIGKPCKTLQAFKENESGYIECVSKKGKKVWGNLSIYEIITTP